MHRLPARLACSAAVSLGFWSLGPASVVSAQPAEQVVRAEIRLGQSGSGCTVEFKTPTVTVSRSSRPFVRFRITNTCGTTAEVAVANFRKIDDTNAPDPIETPAQGRRVSVGANSSSEALQLKVRNVPVAEGLWNYDVFVNGQRVDPVLQIDR